MRWVSGLMGLSALLALVSSVGMGVLTSNTLQVGAYTIALSMLDTIQSTVPSWIHSKRDMDTPLEFLTDGSVADAIIHATLTATDMRAAAGPQLQLAKTLERIQLDLERYQHSLTLAAATLWSGLKDASWRRIYENRLQTAIHTAEIAANQTQFPLSWFGDDRLEVWRAGNLSLAGALRANWTRFQEGDIDEILCAYGQTTDLKRRILNLRTTFQLKYDRGSHSVLYSLTPNGAIDFQDIQPALQKDLLVIESALTNATIPHRILRLFEHTLQEELVVRPRLAAVRSTLQHERSMTAYAHFWAWEKDREGKIARAGAHLRSTPSEAAAFEEFLTKLQSWGFDFPEDIGRKVLGSERLTRRDLLRRLSIAQFQRAPNIWITLFIVSVCIGLTGFGITVLYSVAFILNMGILGTTRNLVGIVYYKSEGALRRAKAEMLTGPKPEAPLPLEDGRHAD